MHEFATAVRHLDHQTLQYHLERGDFSRWLDNTIADMDLATRAAVWEDELQAHRAADLERIRHELAQAIEDRYLPAQGHHSPTTPTSRPTRSDGRLLCSERGGT